jgi:hypothetical protein
VTRINRETRTVSNANPGLTRPSPPGDRLGRHPQTSLLDFEDEVVDGESASDRPLSCSRPNSAEEALSILALASDRLGDLELYWVD